MRNTSFEDSLHPKINSNKYDMNKVIVLSNMLHNVLSSQDNEIIFVNSNGNYSDFIASVINNGNTYLCYLDVVADNPKTIIVFSELLQLIIRNNAKNIYLVPAPCIEYYALKSFGDINDDEVKIAVGRKEYTDTKTFKNNMNPNKANFEKYCKALVSTKIHSKYRGSIDKELYNIDSKEEQVLVRSLPIFYATAMCSFETHTVLIKDVISRLYSDFKSQVDLYSNQDSMNLLSTLDSLFQDYISNIIDS